jgi:hypothetical protein
LHSFFILSTYHKLSAQLNGDLHSIGWEKVWRVWQSASGYCPQPVGVQGTWSAAGEVCFPSPSWRNQPTASLYYNGDRCEYHEERVWNNYLCNMVVGEGSFLLLCILHQPVGAGAQETGLCAMPDLKACMVVNLCCGRHQWLMAVLKADMLGVMRNKTLCQWISFR